MSVKLIDPRYYGASPITQPSGAGQAAVATTAITTAAITTTTNAYGYATTTQANNIAAIADAARTLVNQLRSDLVTLGLIKGSA
jgi:hypothetical protein